MLGFDYPTYVHIAPDIEYLERAYDDAKYGWYSTRPFVTPVVPTILDDTWRRRASTWSTCSAAMRPTR